MVDNPFGDEARPPEDDEVAAALGRAAGRWDELHAHLEETYPPVTATWKYWKSSGWIRQLVRKKRTILWLAPSQKHFRASTAFGEKAVAAAEESALPRELVETILSARKYAEGRPVRVEIRTKKDLEVVKQVAAIKMAN